MILYCAELNELFVIMPTIRFEFNAPTTEYHWFSDDIVFYESLEEMFFKYEFYFVGHL